jgi:hypothetical protein
MKLYPRANENRTPRYDPAIRPLRLNFIKAAGINFLALQLLFLGLFAYIFGSLFQQNSHVHNLNILFVDYDGGAIGTFVRDAYTALQGRGFPTLIERTTAEFSSLEDLEAAVCHARYWAAVYVAPDASNRLQSALAGNEDSAYNNSNVLAYIWNEARYPTTSDTLVAQKIETLLSTARLGLVSNETEALRALAANTSNAVSIFANPWQPVSRNIMPTAQGSRLIYNTIVVILVLLQEFFYLGTINGLSQGFDLYRRLPPYRIILCRLFISVTYTFVGSLSTTGAIWAFRDGWAVSSNQFALSWATFWLFAHVNFLTFDVFTVWLPLMYVPMALVAWVILNVTSLLLPFELMPGFYRWSYAMPANELYATLLDIWSGGCYPRLHISLPILFSFEVAMLALSSLGIYRRCHYAVVAGELQQKAFREKLDAALVSEGGWDKEAENGNALRAMATNQPATSFAAAQHEEDESEQRLSHDIRREEEQLRQSYTGSSQGARFEPHFDVFLAGDVNQVK